MKLKIKNKTSTWKRHKLKEEENSFLNDLASWTLKQRSKARQSNKTTKADKTRRREKEVRPS